MANITRIKNNQITDATIEYTKIKSGTLVGSVFNANLTLNSNVTILGNLTIAGTPTTIQSTNTYVNDPLIVFNNGYVGSPSYDIGMIANRNLQSLAPYGSVNMAWIWEETAQQWQAIATTETGTTTGTINNSGFANLRVGNAVVQTITVSNSVSVGTTLGVTGSTTLTGALTFTTATGGGIQSLAIGNVTPGTGAFTTLTASGATTVTNATTSTSSSTGALVVSGGVGVAGNVYGGGNYTSALGLYTTGAFNGGYTNGVIIDYTSGLGRISVGATDGLKVYNGGPAASELFVIDATGNIVIPATTTSSSTTTGALVVKGGTGVAGALNVGGAVALSSTLGVTGATTLTTATTGGLQAVAIGNVTPGTGAFTTLSASGTTTLNTITAASFQGVIGNVTPAAGTFTTITAQTESVGGLQAVAIGNVTPGTGVFTSLTTQTETVGGLQAVAIGNVTPGTAAFTTQTTGGLQAVAIGNVTPGTAAFTTLTASGAVTATSTTDSSTTSTGAVVVSGGVGIAKNLNVGGSAVIAGNLTVQGTLTSIQSQTLDVTDLNVTIAKGAASAAAANGAGLTVDGAGATLTYSNADDSWNVNKLFNGTSATFNTESVGGLQAVAIGNVTPGTGVFTTLTTQTETVGGLQAVAIGNVTPGTAAFTTLTTTSTIIASGNIVGASGTASTSNVTGAIITTGGIGATGNINVGTVAVSNHMLHGNVRIGQGAAGSATNTLVVSNTPETITPRANAIVHVIGKTITGIIGDSFGSSFSTNFTGRHARGTPAAPTAVQASDRIVQFTGLGYGSTGYPIDNVPAGFNLNEAGMSIHAAETFTDLSNATYLNFWTIPTGANTGVVTMKLDSTGNVVIPSTTATNDLNTGALLVKGGIAAGSNIRAGGDFITTGYVYGNGGLFTGNVSIQGNQPTNTYSSGALTVAGGVSTQGNLYVGQNLYIGQSAFNTDLTAPTIVATEAGISYAQLALKNTSSSGSADMVTYSSAGTDAGGWMDMGFTGNAFSDPNYTITASNDGYIFARPESGSYGGNLVIATSEAGSYNDIVIAAGSFYSNSEVARFHGNTSNNGTFVVKLPTNAAPAANTGAFQVWGGGSFSSNLYAGGAVTINGSQTAGYDFKVGGKNSTNLLWARPSSIYDQVIMGNTISAASLTGGAKLIINSTDSILLPAGTNAQRPSSTGFTDVAGMFRYNTTVGAIEFYSGTSWQSVSTQFTVITDEQFNGDGSTVAFTMAATSTTAATIVSINGVLQIPTLAYSVSGTTLTFTEAPATGDLIDVRRLTTTQTITNITSVNGYMGFSVDNDGAYVSTGVAGPRNTTYWEPLGAEVGAVANVSVASANTLTTIDTMDTTKYRSAKYLIQVTNGTNYQISEALVVSDGTTATAVSYGVVQTNGNLGIVTATQSSTNTLVQFTAANASNQVRVKKTYMLI